MKTKYSTNKYRLCIFGFFFIFFIQNVMADNLEASVTNASGSQSNDGSIDLTVSGGIAPYIFEWSNGASTEDISNLPPGEYCVTVTDDFCGVAELCVEVKYEGCSPLILLGIQHYGFIRCPGGTGTFTANTLEGQPPYSFEWSNGATTQTINNIPAGLYCVTVTDADGCSNNMCLTMTEPDPLIVTGMPVWGTCLQNGSITLDVTGGVAAPYTYMWDDGYSGKDRENLEQGEYCVQVIDKNGCEAEAVCFTIKVTEYLGIQLDELTNSNDCVEGNCNGSINISVPNSNGGATYSWIGPNFISNSEDISGLCPGTYTVTASYGGCTGTKTFDICCCNFTMQEPHEPTNNQFWCGTEGEEPLFINAIVTPIYQSGTNTGMIDITVSGGSSSDYMFTWTSTNPSGFTSTAEDISNLAPNRYCVSVRDGCHRAERCFDVVDCEETNMSLSATTQPACPGYNVGTINLMVTNGQSPFTYEWNTGQNTQNLSNLSAGQYCVTVTDRNNCFTSACFSVANSQTQNFRDDCSLWTNCGSQVVATQELGTYEVTNPTNCAFVDVYCSDGYYVETYEAGVYFNYLGNCTGEFRNNVTDAVCQTIYGTYAQVYYVSCNPSGCNGQTGQCTHVEYCDFGNYGIYVLSETDVTNIGVVGSGPVCIRRFYCNFDEEPFCECDCSSSGIIAPDENTDLENRSGKIEAQQQILANLKKDGYVNIDVPLIHNPKHKFVDNSVIFYLEDNQINREISTSKYGLKLVEVYPNPFTTSIKVKLTNSNSKANKAAVEVQDLLGKTISKQNFEMVKGENTWEINIGKEISDGVYQLIIRDNIGNQIATKIIHQKN